MAGLHVDLLARVAENKVLTDCCNAEPVVTRTVTDLLRHWPQEISENGTLVVGEGHYKESVPNDDPFVVLCPKCNATIETEAEEH
jgi:hypothetical protein